MITYYPTGTATSQIDDSVELPLAIRDIPPAPDATRLTERNAYGYDEGLHTGGAWLYAGDVFKPLDGRPYANANFHVHTQEAKVLREMAGTPLFPVNWRMIRIKGRNFIVRPYSLVWPYNLHLTRADAAMVVVAVAALNKRGWEVNDWITLGKDPTGTLFLLDLSAAQFRSPQNPRAFRADDRDRVERFLETCGYKDLMPAKWN
jgi:hypothetical protein